MTTQSTITINRKPWIVADVVAVEEYFAERPRLLARAMESGISCVLFVKRPNGRSVYPMYQNTLGRVWSVS